MHDTLSATASFVAQLAKRRARIAGSILTEDFGVAFFSTGLGGVS